MTEQTVPMVGCGILKKEIDFLIQKNSWSTDVIYLPSSLHIDFEKLDISMHRAAQQLQSDNSQELAVVYGMCHPLINSFMQEMKGHRTEGQNCVELLLGKELFSSYLSQGGFFLMEDWACHWDNVVYKAFGENPEIIREIFSEEHSFLLCIRTPVSKDFSSEAEAVSKKTGLPLRWIDITLNHLELCISNVFNQFRDSRDA